MRLDKFLCEMNIGSRSQVKTLIRQKQVTVNGAIAASPEQKIQETLDEVAFRGTVLHYSPFVYYLMNKPAGIVSATEDNRERTVLDLLRTFLPNEEQKREIFPVGRLDKDTTGLLLLTDDGALAHNLLAPGKHVKKTYLVEMAHELSAENRRQLEQGVDIGEKEKTLPAQITEIPKTHQIYLTIQEGKFHQIKRMLKAVDNEVLSLKRVSFGPLTLDETLEEGQCRALSGEELQLLKGGKL